MTLSIIEKPNRVLLLTSYCDPKESNCSNEYPCDDCLKMCNVAIIPPGTEIEIIGGLEYTNEMRKKE